MGKLLKRNKKIVIGGAVILIYAILTVLAPLIAPYGFDQMRAGPFLQAPNWGQLFYPVQGETLHLMGTDNFGRDIFTRVLYGGQTSLGLSLLATVIAMFLGIAIGSLSGFIGGKFDAIVMRIADVLTSIPWILMAIIITAILGAGAKIVVLAMGITHAPEVMRIMRGEAVSIREREYVEAAYAVGERRSGVLMRYVLPNSIATIIVQATLIFSKCIIMESAISYCGYGVQPPNPSWGLLLANSQQYMWEASYYALFPGIVIVVVVLAVNLFGDGLRDELDPKFNGKR